MHQARDPRLVVWVPLLVSVWILGFTVGCSTKVSSSPPALPPGFDEYGLPNVNLNGYVYFDAGKSVTLPPLSLRTSEDQQFGNASVEKLAIVLGNNIQQYFVNVHYVTAQGERLSRPIQGPSSDGIWQDALKEYRESRDSIGLSDLYPDVWRSMGLLPSNPSLEPVAAGFLREAPRLVDSLLELWGIVIPGLGGTLDLLRVDALVFAGYANGLEVVPMSLNDDPLVNVEIGIIIVGPSSYPAVVVDGLLANFSGLLGLREVSLGSGSVQYRNLGDDVHMMVRSVDSQLIVCIASTRQIVRQLILDWE